MATPTRRDLLDARCAPERPARADAIADDIADIACGALIPAMRGPFASVESRWPARRA